MNQSYASHVGARRELRRDGNSLVLLGELALELADELEQAVALRRLVGLALRDGERPADAVEEREGAAEAARVALAPVDGVEPDLLHQTVGREVHVHALRRVHDLLAGRLAEKLRIGDVRRERARVEPDAVRLQRVDAEHVVLRVDIEALLELEIPEGLEVLLLPDRADDGRAELEALGEAGALVLRAEAKRQDLLRAGDDVLGLGKVGREEQRLPSTHWAAKSAS